MITAAPRITRQDRSQIEAIVSDAWHHVFQSLDSFASVDTDDAGRIATEAAAIVRRRLEEAVAVDAA